MIGIIHYCNRNNSIDCQKRRVLQVAMYSLAALPPGRSTASQLRRKASDALVRSRMWCCKWSIMFRSILVCSWRSVTDRHGRRWCSPSDRNERVTGRVGGDDRGGAVATQRPKLRKSAAGATGNYSGPECDWGWRYIHLGWPSTYNGTWYSSNGATTGVNFGLILAQNPKR